MNLKRNVYTSKADIFHAEGVAEKGEIQNNLDRDVHGEDSGKCILSVDMVKYFFRESAGSK